MRFVVSVIAAAALLAAPTPSLAGGIEAPVFDQDRIVAGVTHDGRAFHGPPIVPAEDIEIAATHRVECEKGQRIGQALMKVTVPMTVLISGICPESVTVRTPGVTLQGVDAAAAIRPPAGLALAANHLVVRNLTLTGATTHAFYAIGTKAIVLDRVTVVGNHAPAPQPVPEHEIPAMASAVLLDQSEADILDSVLNDNDAPLLAYHQSQAVVRGSRMNDNPAWGLNAEMGSRVELYSTELLDNGFGFLAGFHSSFDLIDSSIVTTRSVPLPGLSENSVLWDHASMRSRNATIDVPSIGIEFASSFMPVNTFVKGDVFVYHMSEMLGVVLAGAGGGIMGNVYAINFADVQLAWMPMNGVIVCVNRGRAALSGVPAPQPPMIGCE